MALAGCATSGPVRPPGAPAAARAPALASGDEPCADAVSCRAALWEAKREADASECGTQRRSELARRACEVGVAEGCTLRGREELEASTARGLFQRGCAGGDAEGCARHALTTLLGEGVARDEAAGQAELREACDRAPASACGLAVGSLVAEARRRGAEPAWEWLALFAQRGCDAGDGLACRLLGDAFYAGHGVSADSDKAAELYARACEVGDGQACAQQGLMLASTASGSALPRADDLFTRGCDLGSPEACRLIVLKTLDAHGDVKDGGVRRALFRHACDQGAALGCLALYDLLRGQPAQPGARFQLPALLKRACRLGEAQACEFLEDVSRAARPRCAQGSASACGVMGVLLVSPPTVGSEAAEGLRLLRQACAAGDVASCSLLNDRTLPMEDLTCQAR